MIGLQLALIDLTEEDCGKEVLEKSQADIANNEAVYDKEYVAEAREYLHDYLKKCIEYYNELEVYLAKASKSKVRVRKNTARHILTENRNIITSY